MLVSVMGWPPVFSRYTVCGLLVVPTRVPASDADGAKLSEVGVRVTAGAMPLPLTEINCGPVAALSAMVTVAANGVDPPGMVPGGGAGENVTEILQDAPGATVAPQLEVAAK